MSAFWWSLVALTVLSIGFIVGWFLKQLGKDD